MKESLTPKVNNQEMASESGGNKKMYCLTKKLLEGRLWRVCQNYAQHVGPGSGNQHFLPLPVLREETIVRKADMLILLQFSWWLPENAAGFTVSGVKPWKWVSELVWQPHEHPGRLRRKLGKWRLETEWLRKEWKVSSIKARLEKSQRRQGSCVGWRDSHKA